MLVSTEIVFDREPTGESVSSVARVRWALVGSDALLAIVIALVVLRVSEPTSQKGAQAMPAGSFVLEQAEFDGWEPLAPTAGELRAGFPAPMVWKGDRVCIGLARTDFGPEDFRPSTARCERQRAGNMAANEIRSLLSIRSGFDTWHFIEAPGDIAQSRCAWRPERPWAANEFICRARLPHCDSRTAAILRPSSGRPNLSDTDVCLTRPPDEPPSSARTPTE
ncbi:MAG: hypothetical protein ACI9CV_000460 [Ilumatobacter sp.]|jgi:hypothetical protein